LIETILLYGAISGAIFALLALGFTLIYGVSGVVNLAHGAFFMLGAYAFFSFGSPVFFQLEELVPWIPSPILALILAAIFVGVVGSIVYRLTVHPVIEDEIAVMVVTVCLALILQQLMLLYEDWLRGLGFSAITVPPLLGGSITFLGVTERYSRLLAFAVSLGLFFSMWLFIAKSKIGKAMRAVSQDREAAMLMGINTERLYMLTMAISASFAAVAGVCIAGSTTFSAHAYMWLQPLAMSFAIVILGGLGSIKGTIVGGFIVGYAKTIVENLVPEGGNVVPAVPFMIMVLMLLLRPKGIFGKRIEMEE
jgi:branched-chain amino acid transport system permease protein